MEPETSHRLRRVGSGSPPSTGAPGPVALVAEPDSTFGAFLAQVLAERGYRVRQASSVDEALAHAARDELAVALVSSAFPPDGGTTLCLRLQPYGVHQLVLLGPPEAGGAARAPALGATFLPLPFTPAQLQAILQPGAPPS